MSKKCFSIRGEDFYSVYPVGMVHKVYLSKTPQNLFSICIWHGRENTTYKYTKYSEATKDYVRILKALGDTKILTEFLGTLDLRVELWKTEFKEYSVVKKWLVDGVTINECRHEPFGESTFTKKDAEKLAKGFIESHYNKEEPEYGEEMTDVFEAKTGGE